MTLRRLFHANPNDRRKRIEQLRASIKSKNITVDKIDLAIENGRTSF